LLNSTKKPCFAFTWELTPEHVLETTADIVHVTGGLLLPLLLCEQLAILGEEVALVVLEVAIAEVKLDGIDDLLDSHIEGNGQRILLVVLRDLLRAAHCVKVLVLVLVCVLLIIVRASLAIMIISRGGPISLFVELTISDDDAHAVLAGVCIIHLHDLEHALIRVGRGKGVKVVAVGHKDKGLLLIMGANAIADDTVVAAVAQDVARRVLEHEELAELGLEANGAVVNAAALLGHFLNELQKAELEGVDRGACDHARGEGAEIGRVEHDLGRALGAGGLDGLDLCEHVLGDGVAGELVRMAGVVVKHDVERGARGVRVGILDAEELDGLSAVRLVEALAIEAGDEAIVNVKEHAVCGLGHQDGGALMVSAIEELDFGGGQVLVHRGAHDIARRVGAVRMQERKRLQAWAVMGYLHAMHGAKALERMC
jgi:hypothetical protein